MGISPFMAFTKGAFEGYNQLQEQKLADNFKYKKLKH